MRTKHFQLIFEWGATTVSKQPDQIYDAALSQASFDEALSFLRAHAPRDFVIYNGVIQRSLRFHFNEPDVPPGLPTTFSLPIRHDLLANRCIVISGGAGCGKTTWAVAHFRNCLLVSHKDDLKRLSPSNDGIVFDDFRITHWPIQSVIHLCDMAFNRSIDVKHSTVSIPRGLKRIFTTNQSRTEWMPPGTEEEIKAVNRRIQWIHVTNKLYKETTV